MESGSSHMLVMVVSHKRSADGLVDNGFTNDGNGVGHGNGLSHMVRGGHLNNLLHGLDDVIRHVVGHLDMDGLVDGMDLLFDSDDGGSVADGSLQGSGHGDLEIRNGRLQDLSGVARNVRSLAEMSLFGDDGIGFVDGGHVSGFLIGEVGGGQRDGGGDVAHGFSSVHEWGGDDLSC